jgi:hypothetical protein
MIGAMRVSLVPLIAVAACGGGSTATNPDAPPGSPDAAAPPLDARPPDAAAPTPDARPPDAAAPDAAPPPSISDWMTKDPTPLLSVAGTWNPIGVADTALIPFWGVARLGAAQLQGVVLGGWSFGGSFGGGATDVNPVTVALLAQRADGTLAPATGAPSLVTNGEGSVNVADFNGDGKDDIFLAAHNESPFLSKASTVYVSNGAGSLTKVTLGDAVQDHDANVAVIGGKPAIVAMSFAPATPTGNPLLYQYDGHGGFSVSSMAPDPKDGGAGMSVAAGDFTGNGTTEVVVGDMSWGLGIPYDPSTPMQQFLFTSASGKLVPPGRSMPAPYFNGKPEYASYVSQWDPASKTHSSRVWVDDLNQDGLLDVVVNGEIWSGANGLQKNVLQILINQGGLSFVDATDTLNPDYDKNVSSDYSLRMADVDDSGINSYFTALTGFCTPSDTTCRPRPGAYILVNDGSGRLHVAMHDEFVALGAKLNVYMAAEVQKISPNGFGDPQQRPTPWFIAYQTPNGKLSFLAVAGYSQMVDGKWQNNRYIFVNVPLQIDLAKEYRENLVVADRNGSRRIRTFAGDDTISAKNAGMPCTVDGGAGTDTAVYPGKKSDYTVTKTATGWTVVGPQVNDTLKNVEILKFSDGVTP